MLTINNQSDYALLLVSSLMGKDNYIPLSDLVEKTNLPHRFLARIAAQLVKKGVLSSREGKVGGYKLSNKFRNMNLYNFLTIFEGDLLFAKCLDKNYECRFEDLCAHKDLMKGKINKILEKNLSEIKVTSLFKK